MENFTIIKQTSTSVLIEIAINSLKKEDYEKFFGKELIKNTDNTQMVFAQDEDFVFDIDTLLYLELDPRYSLLKKGVYPTDVNQDKIMIMISLSLNK